MGDGAKSGERSVLEFKVEEMWNDLYEGDEPLVTTFRNDRAVQADRDVQADKRTKRMEVIAAASLSVLTFVEVVHLVFGK